ncbi:MULTISPECIES: NUDIX domain-containing protein [unclassified Frigoribacterium]|uniref:NUDIX hydrolase n=1 Tax=unclassified Frigoribacterium TaxID=2627005 RepID=UPI0015638703|nr:MULTISPECIES: NUDIX domain-containing protein [unclassified Frigoribacterium]NQW86189.1 NUDIX domain-containing protein [Frigoribacterium sp. VKM Ac-2860]NQX07521.1 NUDIX domain-containing protein [Frigoribacterium sp. VKM Ac-2859]
MATPDFVLSLREKIGTAPLWLAGVTAVVVRGDETLLVRRADTGAWTPVTDIVDPGEHPADAAVRETLEEADLNVVPERLASIGVTDEVVYPNGDRAQYLDHTFVMRYVSGEPSPADGENTEARWFRLDDLPTMGPDMLSRLDAALSGEQAARFGTSSS